MRPPRSGGRLHNDSLNSTNSSNGRIPTATLDKVYLSQLSSLRELIFRKNHEVDINLCRKWLKVFSRTCKSEKMARNCLCALMFQQLQELGCLAEPFTDIQNCNRDLDSVLRSVDEEMPGTLERMDLGSLDSIRSSMPNQNVAKIASIEAADNESQVENITLRKEIEALRYELMEKEIENSKLKETVENYQFQLSKFGDGFKNMKNTFLETIKQALQELETCSDQFKLFQTVFSDFAGDNEFLTIIREFDEILKSIIEDLFQKELDKHKDFLSKDIYQKIERSKSKLRNKYQRRLDMQNWAQQLQLKLVKLRCFSSLRQSFMNTVNVDNKAMWDIFKLLEDKYQKVIQEVI